MSLAAPTPPLLLTKRLTAFLRANLSAQIHTALLTTLSGKLLAHATPHPVATLRTQATVAALLWALYASPDTADAVAASLPPHASPQALHRDPTSSSVTAQLTGAVLVIRRLTCDLLFICIGPPPEEPSSHHQPRLALDPQPSPLLGSPSEVESVTSTGAHTTASTATTTTNAVVAMRRQTEELAKWLNDKLGSLGIPDETTGGFEPR
ncbi:hypothetical protein F5Y16DRAFT_94953 [Xylariaceae sp. FL0255]|nr:hypothetical protein F5Y16DRAFT_94953 [Xylariaceae sp. FL0255]